ncbi:hypothetical protein K461DRAFT_283251 [Myriangium duriaei CBS 260.36]|uniref:Uncharacterized protein n=1 Tax=Myriangium duriaei CBS 260.36 TaxID=1168546 RepID=A0A9P4IVJ2_9PEZI|nr:hypothetical protein K461DRAFT_283251 [Myriangium duriaei CBS 260.36]
MTQLKKIPGENDGVDQLKIYELQHLVTVVIVHSLYLFGLRVRTTSPFQSSTGSALPHMEASLP